jgi:hypothetical protein
VHTAATEGIKPTKADKAAAQAAELLAAVTAADVKRFKAATVVQLSSAEHARRLALVTQQYTAYKQSAGAAAAVVGDSAAATAATTAAAELKPARIAAARA